MNRGSEWHKWDLHFHTPSSYDYEDGSVTNDDIVNGLLANDVSAVAITDHHVIDVERISELQRIAAGRITILPGIEFLSDARGKEPIHIIGIFSEKADLENIWGTIKFKTNIHKIYYEGVSVDAVYNDLVDTCELIHSLGGLVTIHAGKKSNSIENIPNGYPHFEAQKDDVSKHVDIFDIGKVADVEGYKKHVFPVIGRAFPMVLCSDNHNIRNYTVKQSCWIKGMTNFAGLKQIIFEPDLRVRIQSSNPDNKLGRLVITEAEFEDTHGLFGKQTIHFNENLNSIIGGKSSGKSLLLHSMANAIDAAQVGRISDALNIPRTYFDGSYQLKVRWKDDYENVLSSESEDNRKITYIPQLYINYLAEKDNEEELNNLLISILRQNTTFAAFYVGKKNEIANKNGDIQKLLGEMLKERNDAIDTFNALKETGKVADVQKSIDELKKKIEAITKASSLTPEEQTKYRQFLADEQNLQKWIAYYKGLIELIAQVSTTVDNGIEFILGERVDSESGAKYSKLLSILAPYQIPDDFKQVVNTYETNQRNLQTQFKASLKALNYEAKIQDCEKQLVKIREDIKPVLAKVTSQKDLEVLKGKLQAETSRLEKSKVLDKKFKESAANYRAIQQKTGDELTQLYALYKEIVDTVNLTYSNITDEIKLVASLGYAKEESLFYPAVNKNKLTDSAYFYTLYPKDSNYLNLDEMPRFFKSIRNARDGALNYSLDGTNIVQMPLNQDYESIDDLYKFLLEDHLKLHFDIQYKNDHLLQMSPGKKGTVLLILFLELSSAEYPIFIDQPEDNLDNRTIYDLLCKMIREKKQSRQIIIVSHNANLVVATDSENVIVANQLGQSSSKRTFASRFEYVNGPLELSFDNSADPNLSELQAKGIKEHVCDILEGGIEAFHNRESRYLK